MRGIFTAAFLDAAEVWVSEEQIKKAFRQHVKRSKMSPALIFLLIGVAWDVLWYWWTHRNQDAMGSKTFRRMAPIVALVLLSGCPKFVYAAPIPEHAIGQRNAATRSDTLEMRNLPAPVIERLGYRGSEVVEGVQSIADEFGPEVAAELEAAQFNNGRLVDEGGGNLVWYGPHLTSVADNAEPVADTPEEIAISGPATVPVGGMDDFTILHIPEGAKVGLVWTVDGKTLGREHVRLAADSLSAVIALPPGQHTVAVFGGIFTGEGVTPVSDSWVYTVGDPPPPKPLAELAGPHKQALADWYFAQIDAAAYIATPEQFHLVHGGKLATLGLAGSEYATEAAKRFADIGEGDWPLPLIDALKAIVKELGAPAPKPDTPSPTTPATAATYIHEKDDSPVPSAVRVALDRLNRERNIRATEFEDDATDGDGDVPEQYKVPLAAARQAGLPAFVVTAGSDVLKVVRDPRTEAQVFEAIAP